MSPASSPELHERNDRTGWWSITVDAHVIYYGSEIQCRRRFAILTQPMSRAGPFGLVHLARVMPAAHSAVPRPVASVL
jgi:hypothetical protein